MHASLISSVFDHLLQILMNVKNEFLSAHKTWSASTHPVPLFAQVSPFIVKHIVAFVLKSRDTWDI